MALVPRRSMSLQELLVLAFLADRHVTIAQDTLYESQELEDQFEGGQAPNISALANSVHWLRQCIFFLQVWKPQCLTRFQRELSHLTRHHGHVPGIDLDWQ